MKILVAFASFISLSFNCLAQCSNVTVKTDRFTDVSKKQTINPLVLENDKYKILINIECINGYYEIDGVVRDKFANGYEKLLLSNMGNVALADNSGIFFVFNDGKKSTFYNQAGSVEGKAMFENTSGLIVVPFRPTNSNPNYAEIEQKIVNQFIYADVVAIRIAGVNKWIDLDFDLKNEQMSFFKDALSCMESSRK